MASRQWGRRPRVGIVNATDRRPVVDTVTASLHWICAVVEYPGGKWNGTQPCSSMTTRACRVRSQTVASHRLLALLRSATSKGQHTGCTTPTLAGLLAFPLAAPRTSDGAAAIVLTQSAIAMAAIVLGHEQEHISSDH